MMYARQIRKFRERMNKTQVEFAKMLDLTTLTIVRWENAPPKKKLKRRDEYAIRYLAEKVAPKEGSKRVRS